MNRRDLIIASFGVVGAMATRAAGAAKPCPPPTVSVTGGTTATTSCGAVTQTGSYSTQFAGTENPLSEGGVWTNGGTTGLDWTNVQKTPGLAYATTASGYQDSIACLSGYPADMSSRAIVRRGSIGAGESHEIELLHRFKISAHNARGYEVLVNNDGGYQFMRWNGAMGDFTELSGVGGVSGNGTLTVRDGDEIRVDMIGNMLSLYQNGVFVASVDITRTAGAVWTDGSPGIGFDKSAGSGTYDAFAWKSFTTQPA